jgi:hypothetical protein
MMEQSAAFRCHRQAWREHGTSSYWFVLEHGPELLGQTIVVIGGSAGIGLETARRAHLEGANAGESRNRSSFRAHVDHPADKLEKLRGWRIV